MINLNELQKLYKKKTCLLSYLRLLVSVSVFGLWPDVFPARYSVSTQSEKHTFGHSLVVVVFSMIMMSNEKQNLAVHK